MEPTIVRCVKIKIADIIQADFSDEFKKEFDMSASYSLNSYELRAVLQDLFDEAMDHIQNDCGAVLVTQPGSDTALLIFSITRFELFLLIEVPLEQFSRYSITASVSCGFFAVLFLGDEELITHSLLFQLYGEFSEIRAKKDQATAWLHEVLLVHHARLVFEFDEKLVTIKQENTEQGTTNLIFLFHGVATELIRVMMDFSGIGFLQDFLEHFIAEAFPGARLVALSAPILNESTFMLVGVYVPAQAEEESQQEQLDNDMEFLRRWAAEKPKKHYKDPSVLPSMEKWYGENPRNKPQ